MPPLRVEAFNMSSVSQASWLPGGRPPVPPGVLALRPDGKNRHRIGPPRCGCCPPGGRPPVPPGVLALRPDGKNRHRIGPPRCGCCLPGGPPPVPPGVLALLKTPGDELGGFRFPAVPLAAAYVGGARV